MVILDFDTSPKFDGTSNLIPGTCNCWCPGMINDVKGGIYFFKGKHDKNSRNVMNHLLMVRVYDSFRFLMILYKNSSRKDKGLYCGITCKIAPLIRVTSWYKDNWTNGLMYVS